MVLDIISWGWPGIAAQVHFSASTILRRLGLGMAGNRRSSTLGRLELYQSKRVPTASPVKKEGFVQVLPPVLWAFSHKTPPSVRIGDL